MPSTFSPNLRLELIASGEQANTWGTTTNTNLGTLLEQSITGIVTVDVTSGYVELLAFNGAADQARAAVITVVGTPGSSREVYSPALVTKLYVIENLSDSAVTLYCGTPISYGSGVAVPPGNTTSVFCDGTNIVPATTAIQNFLVNNLTVSALTANHAVVANGSYALAPSVTTSTELGYVSGVTSAIQTQINSKQPTVTVNGIVKGNGSGTLSAASPGTDYVTPSGTGASGTWGINISGNAATATSASSATSATSATTAGTCSGNSATATLATKASAVVDSINGHSITFAATVQGGQPSFLWGNFDGQDTRLYNPGNFSVYYAQLASAATHASTADAVTNGVYNNGGTYSINITGSSGYASSSNYSNSSGYAGSAGTAGSSTYCSYANVLSQNSGTYYLVCGGDGNTVMVANGGARWNIDINGNCTFETLTLTNVPYGGGNTLHINGNTVLQQASSIRFKRDIQALPFGLADVLKLQPITFVYNNDDTNKTYAGFIAEDIDALGLTPYVNYDEEQLPNGLDYAGMVSMMAKAIQELNAKVDALQAEVSALRG